MSGPPTAPPSDASHCLVLIMLLIVYVTVLSQESLSPRQLYSVLGNSVNVRVVAVLIHLLVTSPKSWYSMLTKSWWWAVTKIRVCLISWFYSNRQNRENLILAKYTCFTVLLVHTIVTVPHQATVCQSLKFLVASIFQISSTVSPASSPQHFWDSSSIFCRWTNSL